MKLFDRLLRPGLWMARKGDVIPFDELQGLGLWMLREGDAAGPAAEE
jgi:hypothetical protein